MEYEKIMKMTRLAKGETQQQIANLLKTTQPQYYKYENGIQELPIRHLITLARHWEVTTDYLLGLSEEVTKNNKL